MKAKLPIEYHACELLISTGFCVLGQVLLDEAGSRKNTTRPFKRKQMLYYEGAPAQGIYYIQSGLVKVYKIGFEGKQHILRIAHRHDIVGLESLFVGDHYVSEAEIIEAGVVSFIDKPRVMALMQKNPKICKSIMQCLAAQLVLSDAERVDLAQHSVRKRMARLLAILSQDYGILDRSGIRITLMLSREEIAEMVGSAAETAMRLLKEFREEKLVDVHGREIIVLNQERLVEMANISD